ncbi:MAG: universal stress protein [Solirubrobacteraceae bacterium]
MFERVIVGVDGDPSGRDAIAVAGVLMATDGRLALAHVHELSPVRGASRAYGPGEEQESLRLVENERAAAGVDAEPLTVTASSVGRGLHYLAETHEADLLTVGSSRRSFVGRVLIGDRNRAALIGAPCAVAVAPLAYADDGGAIATIGVGYDGSPESESALACARALAARHGAAVTALTVLEPSPYETLVRVGVPRTASEEERAEATAALAALDGVEGEVASGVAGEELALFSDRVDLLVIGSRGYGPIRSLMLGGTAVHLAANARCPLVVLPRDGAGPAAGGA